MIGLSAGDERARMFATRFCCLVSVLSQSSAPVATTSGKKSVNVCPPPKNALPLPTQTSNNACHCKTRSLTIKNYKIMTQKKQNSQKAQELAMEVLDQVNGGILLSKHLLPKRVLAYGC